ncbi:gamma-glutamyl-gamma-aminobutyrate hydrolase family protein [Ferruginivarius sediminum]|uniref:gamma-glutamyl-gamma-aminobutyrate hydrolase n=1 Tax=Ferruginivarius sediminum TaxID=2661937 RepID=A0A369TK00_9PROT|nr:gamma-glutamyl-gamma-aminobutyrate hydrolase family protein [Ferruginivarius sediminum]RDD63236.1 gamma-glutamyl-gamma-aminobutyrate hydrolase family protein [Ferruginivarius sediminum]
MSQQVSPPLIALPACRMEKDGQDFHTIGDKYVRAVAEAAGGLPVMLPSLSGLIDVDDVLRRMDGLVLTGSPSNVHPTEYGRSADPAAEPHDVWRDSITLPLIRSAVKVGVPLFAICRGMQELNVAFGGTLFARVHEVEGRMDHRAPKVDDVDVKYGLRHSVALTPGGLLRELLGAEEIEVNSLHNQGVETPAPGLRVEALADDGTVEALSMPEAPGFVLGVQWHPEYKATESHISTALFQAFARAARHRASLRQNTAAGEPVGA